MSDKSSVSSKNLCSRLLVAILWLASSPTRRRAARAAPAGRAASAVSGGENVSLVRAGQAPPRIVEDRGGACWYPSRACSEAARGVVATRGHRVCSNVTVPHSLLTSPIFSA
jgi:hypothetical protein